MTKISTGMIFTNDNCISCNKCISKCEVIGANICIRENGHEIIKVNETRCLHCGKCLTACGHEARVFEDDTEIFFRDLANGVKISIAIDPSFYIIYPEYSGHILGYLRSKGCGTIYDAGLGGDISVWCHLQYINSHISSNGYCQKYVAQTCPSVTAFAERYSPELRDVIIPVQTPLSCLATYAHKYLHDGNRMAFISPCLSMHDEITSQEGPDSVSYFISYSHLMKYLGKEDLTSYKIVESDVKPVGYGDLLCTPEGFSKYIQQISDKSCTSCSFDSAYNSEQKIFPFISANRQNGIHPDLLAMNWCEQGCLGGPTRENFKTTDMLVTANAMFVNNRKPSEIYGDMTVKERYDTIGRNFTDIDPADFSRMPADLYHQPYTIPDDTFEEIFHALHMDTEESRHINCGYCGYKTCYDMAAAIAYGYSKEENCIHYVRKEISNLSFTDKLTGINNSTGFTNYTSQMLRDYPDKQFVIVVYELESFIIISQLYGSALGEKVLQFAAETLRSKVQNRLGTIARLGSNRFACCIEYVPEVIGFIRKISDFDCRHLGIEQPIHLKAGLYVTEASEQNIERAINYAIMAMESEKASDKSTAVIFNGKLKQRIDKETLIISQMHSALKNKEFVPYLQPQYDHSTGHLVGAEMLCRWRKSDGTIISPGEFIPVFEKNGFIHELDNVMWEYAFECMRNWIDEDISPVPISVNISRITLFDENISEKIDHLQQKYKVPPEYIHFEITESAYMSSQDIIIDTTDKLHNLGFAVAMDDFGSGYSSLNTLKNLPVDILKLDMGFFKGNSTKRGGYIISSIMRMAQGLNLSTIAEGVEDPVLADYLRSIGCDVIQGFLYSKPIPLKDYEKLLCSVDKDILDKRNDSESDLDPMTFFDPDCVESKMFDYYTGGACVFEYENDVMTIIRSNNKYLETICMNENTFDSIRTNFLQSLSESTKTYYAKKIAEAASTHSEISFITKRTISGHSDPVFIRSHIRVISYCGNCLTVFALVENISREKISEEKLRKSMESLELIMDNSPAGICLFSVCINAMKVEFKTIAVNKGFSTISDYSAEEMKNYSSDKLLNMVCPEDRIRFVTLARHIRPNIHQTITYKAMYNGHEQYDRLVRLDYTGIRHGKNDWLIVCNFVEVI